MSEIRLAQKILKDMVYDENIRNGIYKAKSDKFQDFFMYCHSDMLPDDHRYKIIHDILIGICEHEDIDVCDQYEICDSMVPCYTYDLTAWLHSRTDRIGWCNDYLSEVGPSDDMAQILSGGYMQECLFVFGLVIEWLGDHYEGDDDE